MICPKCNRLNGDEKIVCRFCSEVLNQEAYNALSDEEKQLLIQKEPVEQEAVQNKKYFKSGWLVILAVCLAFIALFALFGNFTSQSKKAVIDYAQAYYNADFELTAQESAVNLRKYFETTNKSTVFDFFGLFNKYSSYEDMINQYITAFSQTRQQVESACGADYEVKVKIKKEVKLHDAVMLRTMNEYQSAYGNILREGEIREIRLVYAQIKINGYYDKTPETVAFYAIKISDEWYVLTDSSLHAY